MLWSIDAPHFCCGLIVHRGKVVQAAPILNWTVGRTWHDVRLYMKRKGWSGTPVGPTASLWPR